MTENKTNPANTFWGLVGSVVLGLFVWFILPDSWTDNFVYSNKYNVGSSQVHRADKPTDCDFMHAPSVIKIATTRKQ
jgi:hypothetical protein